MKKFLLLLLLASPSWAASVTLTWDKNPEFDIAHYRIYFGSFSRTNAGAAAYTNVTQVVTNRLSFTNLLGTGPRFFAATAVNTSGLESDFSNEVMVTLPTPPSKPGGPKNLTSSPVTASWKGKTNSAGQVVPIAMVSAAPGSTLKVTMSGPGWSMVRGAVTGDSGVAEFSGKASVRPFIAKVNVTSITFDPWFQSSWSFPKY